MAQDNQYSVTQQVQLTKTANYFDRNLPYLDYATYLKNGWPIASDVIEGTCRHFVKDRCQLSGMRWERTGVECLLQLRAVAENDDWDDYHLFRKQQRHLRLYQSPYPTHPLLEFQALDTNSVTAIQPIISPVFQVEFKLSTSYQQLPLAV